MRDNEKYIKTSSYTSVKFWTVQTEMGIDFFEREKIIRLKGKNGRDFIISA